MRTFGIGETGMSAGVFSRAMGLRGGVHRAASVRDGRILPQVKLQEEAAGCSRCGSRDTVRRETVPRCWTASPIGCRPVTVFADVPRIECGGRRRASPLRRSPPLVHAEL